MTGDVRNRTPIRRRLLNLKPGDTAVFPVERVEYISSLMYRLRRTAGQRYTRQTTGKQVRVTRIE